MSKPRQILVVDDDPGVRDYLESLAVRRGYQVYTAASAEEALELLTHLTPDIVTLDAVLPSMDGLEALSRIKQRLPEVPVIMLSGQGLARTIVEAMKLGASDFLRKPFEIEELDLALEKALETHALREEVQTLRGRVRSDLGDLIIGSDNEAMRDVVEIIDQAADTDITVLVCGESGTGKEVVARALYQRGDRSSGPFVKVNCAALPSELLESELFGFEKGAFTGAQKRKLGKFEYANHGTIFLDEISEMALGLQAKLLQVLQDGEFSRLGGTSDVQVDTRIIAATNRNLEEAVRRGEFREDLYYRLNVVMVRIPPLRERMDSVPILVNHFLKIYSDQYRKEISALTRETMDVLLSYHWPGNVRELENMIKRIVVLGNEKAVVLEIEAKRKRPDAVAERPPLADYSDLEALGADFSSEDGIDLKALSKRAARIAEKKAIERVLEQTRWNRKEAAVRLKISYKALLYKMRETGLSGDR